MSPTLPLDSGPLLIPLVRTDPLEMAERRLWSNVLLSNRQISCEYNQGALTLRGLLPTYYLKQLAQNVVADIPGLQEIVNQIEVR